MIESKDSNSVRISQAQSTCIYILTPRQEEKKYYRIQQHVVKLLFDQLVFSLTFVVRDYN